MKVPGKVLKVGGKVSSLREKYFSPYLEDFSRPLPGEYSKGLQDKKKQLSFVKLYSISKIAFYPHFPLQSQCIPAHLWLLEYLASLDIQTEAIRGRKTLTFWGKSGGKMQFCLSLITFPKKIAISNIKGGGGKKSILVWSSKGDTAPYRLTSKNFRIYINFYAEFNSKC